MTAIAMPRRIQRDFVLRVRRRVRSRWRSSRCSRRVGGAAPRVRWIGRRRVGRGRVAGDGADRGVGVLFDLPRRARGPVLVRERVLRPLWACRRPTDPPVRRRSGASLDASVRESPARRVRRNYSPPTRRVSSGAWMSGEEGPDRGGGVERPAHRVVARLGDRPRPLVPAMVDRVRARRRFPGRTATT